MKITKSRLKEIIREELLKEGKFGAVKKAGQKIMKKIGPHVKDIAKDAASAAAATASEKAIDKITGKKDEGKLKEVDFEKVQLPSQVKRFLDKFVQSMKDANLNRIKRSAILYKVINASGMSPQQLMADIQRIKKGLKK